MKVRDLSEWPPQPGGAYRKADNVPAAEQAVIEKVVRVSEKWITFTGKAYGNQHTYDFEAPSEDVALDLKKILESNIGKTLFSVGDAELSVN